MSPIDISSATFVESAEAFDQWLADRAGSAPNVVVAINNKASGRQTVTLVELQRTAMCHGWVDTQTKRIDVDRYAVSSFPAARVRTGLRRTARWHASWLGPGT